jgi:hypothetical protein
MNEPTLAGRVRAGCPRWLSAQCNGGEGCGCLPFRYDRTPVPALKACDDRQETTSELAGQRPERG